MKLKLALATVAMTLAAAGSSFAGSPTASAPTLNGVTSITITSGYASDPSLWYLQIAEIVASQVGTGTDVALSGATGTSLNQYNASTGVEKAYDGNLSTDYTVTPGYHSLGTPADYYTLTFGSAGVPSEW